MSRFLPLVIAACCAFAPPAPATGAPPVYGWLESAYLQPWGIKVKAKLDTGALTSSIHAEHIIPFERDGEPWVRFTLPVGEEEGYEGGVVVERAVMREARIKDHDDTAMRRYVVRIAFCLDGYTVTTPMTLADRSNFNYPLLLGRRTLRGRALVDPAETFTTHGGCYRREPGEPSPVQP